MNIPTMARLAAVLAVAAAASVAQAGEPEGSALALRERFSAMKVDASPFGLPLHLVSEQGDGSLRGDIHSRLDHRYEAVREALRRPARWCEIMILHPNVKGCRTLGPVQGEGGKIEVRLGRAEHPVEFGFRIVAATDDYFDLRLEAPTGPAGTTDYRIRVEAAPLDERTTLLHLAYSHGYGLKARLAMNAYFNTFGRDKVGFTVVGRNGDGKPVYVGDLRGGMERNAMRYYLAIRSYLEVLALPQQQRLDRSLRNFVAYTERWPLQLGEAPDYAEVKQRDIARMREAS